MYILEFGLRRCARKDKPPPSLRGTQWRGNPPSVALDCVAALAKTNHLHRHCEERSDAAIFYYRHCEERSDVAISYHRLCEERSDAAIYKPWALDCFASLAKTNYHRLCEEHSDTAIYKPWALDCFAALAKTKCLKLDCFAALAKTHKMFSWYGCRPMAVWIFD